MPPSLGSQGYSSWVDDKRELWGGEKSSGGEGCRASFVAQDFCVNVVS